MPLLVGEFRVRISLTSTTLRCAAARDFDVNWEVAGRVENCCGSEVQGCVGPAEHDAQRRIRLGPNLSRCDRGHCRGGAVFGDNALITPEIGTCREDVVAPTTTLRTSDRPATSPQQISPSWVAPSESDATLSRATGTGRPASMA